MTDTTQGPVMAPEVEAEVSRFKQVADKAINAIVDASNLRTDLDRLKVDFSALKGDMEATRRRNQELDETLAHVRRQRDDAEARSVAQAAQIGTLEADQAVKTRELANINSLYEQSQRSLAETRTSKDDLELKLMESEEALTKAKEKLEDIKAMAASLFGLKEPEATPKAPEPVAEPAPISAEAPRGWGEVAADPLPSSGEPSQPTPAPEQTERRPSEVPSSVSGFGPSGIRVDTLEVTPSEEIEEGAEPLPNWPWQRA